MHQDIIVNQNKILEEQHNILKEQQISMNKLISQSKPGEQLDQIKEEIKKQSSDFQNTFYSQT